MIKNMFVWLSLVMACNRGERTKEITLTGQDLMHEFANHGVCIDWDDSPIECGHIVSADTNPDKFSDCNNCHEIVVDEVMEKQFQHKTFYFIRAKN